MKNLFFYTLIILLVASVISFVLGYWKVGMFFGLLLGGMATVVSIFNSVKSYGYGHGPVHNENGNRGKKYRD